MYMCVFYVYSYFITYHRIPAGPEAFGSWPSCPLGPLQQRRLGPRHLVSTHILRVSTNDLTIDDG